MAIAFFVPKPNQVNPMARYRLDERGILQNLSHTKHIWLERIEIAPDGEIHYTERYLQVPLINLLKRLNHV